MESVARSLGHLLLVFKIWEESFGQMKASLRHVLRFLLPFLVFPSGFGGEKSLCLTE